MTTIRHRRGASSQWTSVNPILYSGEIGYETDTGKFKIGNGFSAWSSLSYFNPGAGGGGDVPDNTMVGVEYDGVGWPARPAGGTDIRVHWIGGTPLTPPPGIAGHDLWSVPAI